MHRKLRGLPPTEPAINIGTDAVYVSKGERRCTDFKIEMISARRNTEKQNAPGRSRGRFDVGAGIGFEPMTFRL